MTLKSLFPSTWTGKDDNDVFRDLHSAIDNVFADFGGLSPRNSRSLLSEPRNFGYNYPKTDVSEVDGKVQVEVELPGIEQKDVEVTLEGEYLIVKGERESETETEKKNYHVVERSRGSFKRMIPLGFDADPDSVDAGFSNGVLTVMVSKPAEVVEKVKKIEVREAELA